MIVDTGAILALVNKGDSHHQRVLACIREYQGRRLVVPTSVLPEVDYLITKRYGPHIAIAAISSVTSGEFELETVTVADLPRILALMRQYADASIGFGDASTVAVAERLGVQTVLTLDRRQPTMGPLKPPRHFGPIRPTHCPVLSILP